MPLPIAALIALALGALFAWVARVEIAQSDDPIASSRAFAITAAYTAFVFAPAIAYFAAFHGDWSYMYFIAWRRVPSAVDLANILGCAALVLVGFVATAPVARAKRSGFVVAMIAGPAASAVLLAIVFERRLATSASFAQFSNDFDTHPITATALGRAMLVAITIGAAGAIWCVRLLRAPSRSKPRSR